MAAEIAVRIPAYEPGPSPTIMVSAVPNCLRIASRFSKNGPEFFLSLGHSRTTASSLSNHARLPRGPDSSSAKTFTPCQSRARVLISFEKRSILRRPGLNPETGPPTRQQKRHRQKNNRLTQAARLICGLRGEKNQNDKPEAGLRNIRG